MTELKLCPACNGVSAIVSYPDDRLVARACTKCRMQGPRTPSLPEADGAWNVLPRNDGEHIVNGGMRVKAYVVLAEAVEIGVTHGWQRAHKHTDKPTEGAIQQAMEDAVLSEICSYFEFDEVPK